MNGGRRVVPPRAGRCRLVDLDEATGNAVDGGANLQVGVCL